MPHRFQGTWSYFDLSKAFPPGPANQNRNFVLFINEGTGDIDPATSTVDGRPVQSGRANSNPNANPALDITAVDGRRYVGQFVNQTPPGANAALVLAGKFRDPQNPVAAKKKRNAATTAQNEGDWVLTKP